MATSADGTPPSVDLTGELEVLGRITESSNLAVVARIASVPGGHVIYKPVRGERPLWDFPDGTLAGRDVAAQVVSELGGWHVVPPTVLRDGPLGPGSVQLWIGDPFEPVADDVVVDLVPEGRTPDGWRAAGLAGLDRCGGSELVEHVVDAVGEDRDLLLLDPDGHDHGPGARLAVEGPLAGGADRSGHEPVGGIEVLDRHAFDPIRRRPASRHPCPRRRHRRQPPDSPAVSGS